MTPEAQSVHTRALCGLAPVIPVLVVRDVALAADLGRALIAGGLPVLEVTLRSDAALDVICAMAALPGGHVGAGTVRTADDVHRARDAGATFAVSPGLTDALVRACEDAALPLLPGIATATEAMRADDHGFDMLKLFPAEAVGGIPLLKSLAGPLPHLSFCPTGGITASKRAGLPGAEERRVRRRQLADARGRPAGAKLAARSRPAPAPHRPCTDDRPVVPMSCRGRAGEHPPRLAQHLGAVRRARISGRADVDGVHHRRAGRADAVAQPVPGDAAGVDGDPCLGTDGATAVGADGAAWTAGRVFAGLPDRGHRRGGGVYRLANGIVRAVRCRHRSDRRVPVGAGLLSLRRHRCGPGCAEAPRHRLGAGRRADGRADRPGDGALDGRIRPRCPLR